MSRWIRMLMVGLLLLALFIALNMVAGAGLKGLRLDTTEGSVYTLTTGSRNIARSPDEPVTLTFYYSAKLAEGRGDIQSYARRVRETLEEYARVSGGKVKLRVVDPEPYSEDEDRAVQDGLAGVPLSASETLYMGLVGTNSVDTKEVIAFFDPRKERFLEYDISRLLYSLANPKRAVVGLITGLPLEGGFSMDQRTRQPRQTPPWQIASEIRGLFELRSLGQPTEIPADVTVLMVVHPKELPASTLYAIDQHVMRGGRAIFFVDPLCENDDAGGMMGMGGERASSLEPLLSAWGVEVPAGKMAADRELALRVYTGGQRSREETPYVVWLGADTRAMQKDDAVTGMLKQVMIGSAGFIRAKEGATGGATITPLIHTTATAMEMPTELMTTPPDPKAMLKAYTPGSKELVLAARLTGRLKSAFPDGAPKPEQKPDQPPAPPPTGEALKESKADANVILVADCDLLSDGMWVRTENFFGQQMSRKIADNADFVMSALDNLSGSNDLISVRARRESTRPFTRVQEMQRRADARLLAEQAVLEEKLKDAEANIRRLQQQRGDDNTLVMTPEQQAELDKVKAEYTDTRKKLRQVKLDLQKDIERLGTQLKLINTALVPAIVAVVALGLGLMRRVRRGGKA